MHASGHTGVALMLSSPIVLLLIAIDQVAMALLFVGLVSVWSSIPDVDIYIKGKPVRFRSYPVYHWVWIPILKTAVFFMNVGGKYISRTPQSFKLDEVSHRGITHTLWFGLSFGFWAVFVTALIKLGVVVFELYSGQPVFEIFVYATNGVPLLVLFTVGLAGVLAVVFHCVGDIVTPMGIHFLTPRSDYGYSLDLFYAKNQMANGTAIPLGFIFLGYALGFFVLAEEITLLYTAIGYIALFVVVLPLWVLLIKSPLSRLF